MSIFASGSEVSLAVAAQAQLKEKGVAARVVSMPCFPAFFEQPEDYRRSVIGTAKVKIGVEAAVRFGWDAIIGDGPFIGMKSFGESGPYKAVYKHFGITPEAVVEAALEQASASGGRFSLTAFRNRARWPGRLRQTQVSTFPTNCRLRLGDRTITAASAV